MFMIIALALGSLCNSWMKKLSMMSFLSVVLMKLGMSLRRMFCIGGIHSIVVSKSPFVKKFSSATEQKTKYVNYKMQDKDNGLLLEGKIIHLMLQICG